MKVQSVVTGTAGPDMSGCADGVGAPIVLELDLPGADSPVLDDLDTDRLRAVQEVQIHPSLVLRGVPGPDGAIVDFVCEAANQEAAHSLEARLDDLVGSLLSVAVPAAVADFLYDQCIDALSSGESLRFDDYHVVWKGRERHYDIRGLPVGNRVYFSWRDITQRIRDQRALAESRNRYRLLAENSSDVVLLLGPGGEIEWASPSTREMLGWRPDELLGRDFADLVHAEDVGAMGATQRHPSAVRTQEDVVRVHCADGASLWVGATVRTTAAAGGGAGNRVVALRDLHKRVEALQALEASEARYRMLAEHVSDVVMTVESGAITWISPSVERVLGWRPEELVGRAVVDLIDREDRWQATDAAVGLSAEGAHELVEVRFLTADGGRRWMQVHSKAVDGDAPHRVFVSGLQDVHERQAHQELRDGIAVVDAVLVEAEDESGLLDAVCRALATETQIGLAWIARSAPGADGLEVLAVAGAHGGELGVGSRVTADEVPLAAAAVAALRSGTIGVTVEPGGDHCTEATEPGPLPHYRINGGIPIAVDGGVDLVLSVHRRDLVWLDEVTLSTFEQAATRIGLALGRIRDRRRMVEALDAQALLSTAIEQAGESVVVSDLAGTVIYANPATSRSTGIPLDEIVGRSAVDYATERLGAEFVDTITRSVVSCGAWRGRVVSHDRAGDDYEEQASVTAVRDGSGAVAGWVTVLHNTNLERRLEANLDRMRTDRESVMEAMSGVRVGPTLESTAASFCRAVTRIEGVDVARFVLFESAERLVPLWTTEKSTLGWEVGVPIVVPGLPVVLERTRTGPWWLALDGASAVELDDNPVVTGLAAAGFALAGIAPVWQEGRLEGAVVLLRRTPTPEEWVGRRSSVLGELTSFASTMLGAQSGERNARARIRSEIRAVIDDSAYQPVFQPVVVLDGGGVVGFEALTRFASGRRPDLVFADADSVGLGIELETACALAAVRAGSGLPPEAWLAVNFSPGSVMAGSVATVAAESDRPLVVEITEHVEVQSYRLVRDAVRACPGVRISVDDAGAGYASLRHVLELQPDFVKLDVGLVHQIDVDPARQALAAGLHHYAAQAGNTLIAEGVETPAEYSTLRRLGIPLAQGFFLGRPRPAVPSAA